MQLDQCRVPNGKYQRNSDFMQTFSFKNLLGGAIHQKASEKFSFPSLKAQSTINLHPLLHHTSINWGNWRK